MYGMYNCLPYLHYEFVHSLFSKRCIHAEEVLITSVVFSPIMNCTGRLRLRVLKIKNKSVNNLYLPSVVFIAAVLVGPNKQLKQIFQTESNIVRNSLSAGNWQ